MHDIKVIPLGAGRDVGRSCILVNIGNQHIMLDCGMHMGYSDKRRFPDFSYITNESNLTSSIDAVFISHFHMDHCGALPYMTEQVGYSGPIYMSHPTKAICPILLEDFRKICVERRGESNFFTSQHIKDCMRKVTAVSLGEVIKVNDDLEFTSFYAGHVIGAVMFHIKSGGQSLVYTGDYNMTSDRHLGSAKITRCLPDVLITESTYATTVRDSRKARENNFKAKVLNCVENGGKVLIPVFAMGRAQELCILLDSIWDDKNLKIPIYFAQGLAERATQYYKLFIEWANEKINDTFVDRNMFDYKHIKPWDRSLLDSPGPMVLLATPGMLHQGLSLQVFKKWAPDEKNMIIMPGYCAANTIGHRVINGATRIEFENKQIVEVKLAVEYMSFSAHADAQGILTLIEQCQAKNVVLVHGEAKKMDTLKNQIEERFNISCQCPANGQTITIRTPKHLTVQVPRELLKRTLKQKTEENCKKPKIHGTISYSNGQLKMLTQDDLLNDFGIESNGLEFVARNPATMEN